MCKTVILQILDILKLYKQLGSSKYGKEEIDIYLRGILTELSSKFEDVYILQRCEIENDKVIKKVDIIEKNQNIITIKNMEHDEIINNVENDNNIMIDNNIENDNKIENVDNIGNQ